MKKVPFWVRKVIAFTNNFPCAGTRLSIMEEMENGNFDYEAFCQLCRDSHLAFDENNHQLTHEKYNYGAFYNKFEAIEAAGKTGHIQSMQGYLHELLTKLKMNHEY